MGSSTKIRSLLIIAMLLAIAVGTFLFFRLRKTDVIDKTPVFFSVAQPKDYTPESFTNALLQILTPQEASLIVNPLASNPTMDAWAHQLTAGATNDIQKAWILFDVLASRPFVKSFHFETPGTAQEAISVWNDRTASFRCQENTYLYVALARAVGLKAYFTYVDEQFGGTSDLHDCPAVFINGKVLLADPSYWFGVPHKRFTLENDLQVAGLHLSASSALDKRMKIACALAPDNPMLHLNLFEVFILKGQWTEAQKEMETLMQLDPEGAMTYYVRGIFAEHQGQFSDATRLALKGIKRAPLREAPYRLLGEVYQQQGKLKKAREAFENGLKCPITEKDAQMYKGIIACVRALECREHGDLDGELTNYDQAIYYGHGLAWVFVNRGYVRQQKGDLKGAKDDYKKAIDLQSDNKDAPRLLDYLESLPSPSRQAITPAGTPPNHSSPAASAQAAAPN
jgi:tetratricopeptide (TPR) repeat protein